VFVRGDDGSLMPRAITAGVATTDHVEVLSGLKAGEVVVASANFLVDAESNLGAALNSMAGMDMSGTPAPAATNPRAGHDMSKMNMPVPAQPKK
jgi:Cu(I)/Ag(I) efflux system membrane fusion protein